MRIIYSSEGGVPSRSASSVFGMKMCEAMALHGYDVTFMAPDMQTDVSQTIDLYDFYGVMKIFKVQKVLFLPFWGRRIIASLVTVLKSYLTPNDLIYTRSLYTAFFSCMLGKKCIFEMHMPVENVGKSQECLFRIILNSSHLCKLIVITKALKKHYERKNYGYKLKDKIVIVPDGADHSPEPKPIDLGFTDKLHVGYVGQLYKGKGFELIKAIAPKCDWAVFHCVGGVEEDIQYWKEVSKADPNIIFHGFVPHKLTQQYRISCDVLIAPYLRRVAIHQNDNADISQWMSPLKIFEYMSSKKPIIASNLPVIKEVLTDGVNAYLCNPDKTEEWIAKLKICFENKAQADKIGLAAYQEFVQRYTWRSRIKKIFVNL